MSRGLCQIGRHLVAAAAAWALLSQSGQAHAGYKIGDDKTNLTIGGLLQPWIQVNQDASPGKSTQSEFFVRRMRIILSGQLNEMVNFFVETDAPNFGRSGTGYDVNMFMQDAFVELNLDKALQIDAGMLLAPFSHHGMQGAGSLLAIDYHSDLIRYAPASSKVWRDAGIMVRGLLLDSILEYRLAVFNGVSGNSTTAAATNAAATPAVTYQQQTDPRNRADHPRFVARLAANAFESEAGPAAAGFFYDGLYLKKTPKGTISTKKVLSIGASFDYQKELNVLENPVPTQPGTRGEASRKDYMAVAGDVFVDYPLTDDKLMSLNGQLNVYYYDHGDRSVQGDHTVAYYNRAGNFTNPTIYTGAGMSCELGVRYDFIEPFVVFDYYKATDSKRPAPVKDTDPKAVGDYLGIQAGAAWWIDGHSTTLKLQGGSVKKDGGDAKLTAAVQLQLLF